MPMGKKRCHTIYYFFGFLFLCNLNLSFAQNQKNETYQATDVRESVPAIIQVQPQSLSKAPTPPAALNSPKSKPLDQQPQEASPSHAKELKKDASVVEAASETSKQGEFDPVPDEHINSIAKRIKLAYKILVNHNRAYDYKIHTTPQLNSILDQLNQAQASRSK